MKKEGIKFTVQKKGKGGAERTQLIAIKTTTTEEEVLLDRGSLLEQKASLEAQIDLVNQALAELDKFELENKDALLSERTEYELSRSKGKEDQALLEQILEEKRLQKLEEQKVLPENQDHQAMANKGKKAQDLSKLPENQDHQAIANAGLDSEE